MFNLNDGRWGRDGESSSSDDKPPAEPAARPDEAPAPAPPPPRPRPSSANQGPPDLDEMWRDFRKKLPGVFGNGNNGGRRPGGGGPGGKPPDMKNAGIGIALVAAVALLIWLGTGFFIVQEGYQAVITQFGRYQSTVGAGFNWRLPYPIQRHEQVKSTILRSTDIGRENVLSATGLRELAMLTKDENIVEVKFAVQYRVSDPRAWLFESRDPERAVEQTAETAVREVVGKLGMDTVMQKKELISPQVRTLMQSLLDRYKIGVEVVAVNLQEGGVKPPEQVQAAFDDVLKAGQERERAKNEAQAYANDVIPRATGTASRLIEEAGGYKARISAQAQGDAERFSQILTEYEKAPQVTRDRMYIDTMQQIYANTSKVLVDSRSGSNLLYLPLDKLMQMTTSGNSVGDSAAAGSMPAQSAPPTSTTTGSAADPRLRDGRSRERDLRP
ncbi:MAG: FtsH protease activity modulator HflK [Variovorax sp.]